MRRLARHRRFFTDVGVSLIALVLLPGMVVPQLIPGAAERFLYYWHHVEVVTGQTTFDIPEWRELRRQIEIQQKIDEVDGVIVISPRSKASQSPESLSGSTEGIPIYPYLYYPAIRR